MISRFEKQKQTEVSGKSLFPKTLVWSRLEAAQRDQLLGREGGIWTPDKGFVHPPTEHLHFSADCDSDIPAISPLSSSSSSCSSSSSSCLMPSCSSFLGILMNFCRNLSRMAAWVSSRHSPCTPATSSGNPPHASLSFTPPPHCGEVCDRDNLPLWRRQWRTYHCGDVCDRENLPLWWHQCGTYHCGDVS